MKKITLPVILAILGVTAVVIAVIAFSVTRSPRAPGESPGGGGITACTLEAKLCPDGSAVGRTGPNCEFAPCPGGTKVGCGGPGGSCPRGFTCIQECGPPVVSQDDPSPGYYCERDEIASQPRNCPICLASEVKIATPDGDVAVTELAAGDRVWTMDASGNRVEGTILAVGNMSAPASHKVIRLVLSDGREVRVSPNHPTMDGTPVSDLRSGDAYDGVTVVSVAAEPYGDQTTYDILPDGETGTYWADGIPLQSTLER